MDCPSGGSPERDPRPDRPDHSVFSVLVRFSGRLVALTVLAIFALIGSTNYTLHLHIHRQFSDKRAFNLALDLAMGLTTGMTASNWRIQHRYGHHRGIDQPYRPNRAWETAEYSALGALSYSVRTIWPTFRGPLVESFRKGVLANVVTPVNYRWASWSKCY